MPGDGSAIRFRGIRKQYGRTVAVNGVDLEVGVGQVFGLLGPNGAGKTTLIKMLLGLVRPTEGTVELFGRPAADPTARRHVGFLPEHFRFHEWLTAHEFLEFHGRLYGMGRDQLGERIPAVLATIGLAHRADTQLSTFSKGMLQRIGIAQALLNAPQLLVLDEPTSGLDPVGRREVRDLILDLQAQSVTILLNSHILSEVELVTDEVAILDLGQVVWRGRPTELPSERIAVTARVDAVRPEMMLRLREIAADVSADPAPLKLRGGQWLRFTVASDGAVAQAAAIILASGARLYHLEQHQPSLEELFVSLVQGRDV